MVSQTEGVALIKKQFQESGNMARTMGGQTEPPKGGTSDVAEANAQAAQVAVEQQDTQLRGTSPRENLQPEPESEQVPPGESPQPDQRQEEEMISKSTFLKRTANEVRRRIAAEEELSTLKAEREAQSPSRQEPRQEYQAEPEYDEEEPLARQLRLTNERIDRMEQTSQTNHRDQIWREMVTALGGNKDLAVVVNEVFRYGTAGLDLDEAVNVTGMRNPELRLEGQGDDGRDGPALYAQSGSAEPSGNRTLPDTEEDKDKGFIDRLRQAGNQAERVNAGRDVVRNRIGKMKIFGDRRQRSLR